MGEKPTPGAEEAPPLPPQLSDAEAQREARRRKILQNQEARLQKILGPNSELTAKRIVTSSERSVPSTPPSEEPVLPEEFLTLDYLQKTKKTQQRNKSDQSTTRNLGFNYEGAQGNSAGSPQSIWKNHRTYISGLGAILPFLGLNYFLLYFVFLEVGIVSYLRRIPIPPFPPNIFFTLIMVMGLKEPDVNRIKLALRILSWIVQDLCFFFVATIIPQLVMELLIPQGYTY